MENNLHFIQSICEHELAIVKIGNKILPLTNQRAVFQTIKIEAEGNIKGFLVDCKSIHKSTAPFKISLKYVKKAENLYIDIRGIAQIEECDKSENAFKTKNEMVFLNINVKEAVCYRKKTISLHTSFLQKIFSFKYRTRLVASSVKADINKVENRLVSVT